MYNNHKTVLLAWAEIVDNYLTAILLRILKTHFEFAADKPQLDFYLSTYEEKYSREPARRICWYLEKQLVHTVKSKTLPITPDLRLFELEFTSDTHLIIRSIQRDCSLIKAVKYQDRIDIDDTVNKLNELLKPLLLKVIEVDAYVTPKKVSHFAVVIDTPDAEIVRKNRRNKIID